MVRLTRLGNRLQPLPRRVAPAPKVAAAQYRTPEWRALVAAVIGKRGRRCEDPHCAGSTGRIYADHVIELRDGGALLDERNIMLRCAVCHGRKTARERQRRAGLQTGGGGSKPLDSGLS